MTVDSLFRRYSGHQSIASLSVCECVISEEWKRRSDYQQECKRAHLQKRLFKYSLESRLLQIKFCIITTRVSKYNLPNAPGRVQKPVWDGIDPLSISMIVYLPSERQDLRPNQLFHMYFTPLLQIQFVFENFKYKVWHLYLIFAWSDSILLWLAGQFILKMHLL